jgi:Ni/Fe-hydrogenase subunit HybB-like protein
MMRWLVLSLVLLAVAGLVALASLAASGPEPRWRWGYVAATFSFLLSAGQMAPVLSMTSRVGRGYWGAPLRRVADLLGLTGLVSAPLLIVLLTQLPDWRGRPSVWFDWPGAPGWWDGVAGVSLAFAGAALVWAVTWPERRGLGWAGTATQWRVLTRGVIALGGLYTLLVVFVHLLVASDLALSLVPGWHSAVIPAYHVLSGFQAAVALVVLGLAAVRRLDAPIARSCSKLLLALSLLWFYLVWCELLTYWYGRTPNEQSLVALFMFGPAARLFFVAVVCELLLPLFVLVWNPARRSPRAITVVAAVVVLGNFVDRLRLFLAAWSVVTASPTEHLPETLPPLPLPGVAEVVACLGLFAIAGLVLLLALRRLSPVGAWEVKAVERLTPEQRVLRTRVAVVARPS